MRSFLTQLFILSFCFGQAFAQTENTANEIAPHDSLVQYLSPLEYAFMMHEETKFMLRVPAIGIGVERELLPYTSVMAQGVWRAGRLHFNAELRWYYGSRKKGVRNMSGNYIAGGFFYNGFESSHPYARWGLQRRFIGNGLIDIGFDAGYRKTEIWHPFRTGNYYSLVTNATLGLGLVFNQNISFDRNRVCPVVKCFDVERFLLKLNVSQITRIHYSPSENKLVGRLKPSVALEHKLFNSSFSINVNADVDYGFGNYSVVNLESGDNIPAFIGAEFIAEGRWYYNMQRRIRNGKGGNGLSANYIAGGVRQQYGAMYGDNNTFQPGYIFTTGVQRTIGKRIYFDGQCGIAENLHHTFVDPVEFILNIRTGIKF